MISVIVPVYNAAKYLSACIESILNQDYQDFELLLINDGSTDDSGIICERYAAVDNRIKCFHRRNSGVGKTRNFGIENAKGNWICFIDSDDTVLPNYLSAFNTDNSQADVIICGIGFVNIDTGKIIKREKFTSTIFDFTNQPRELVPILLNGYPFNKAYRSNLVINHHLRFPTDISFHEDHIFVFDCFLKSKIIEVKSDVTYCYRIDYTNQSLSKKRHSWEKHWAASEYMFEKIFKIKDRFKFDDVLLRQTYSFAYEPIISAVYELYDSQPSPGERKKVLKKMLRGDKPTTKYYYPVSLRGRLVKIASQCLPIGLLDFFFCCVNIYQHRRK